MSGLVEEWHEEQGEEQREEQRDREQPEASQEIERLKEQLAHEYAQALRAGERDAAPSYETYERLAEVAGDRQASLILKEVIEAVERRIYGLLLLEGPAQGIEHTH
ncbi:hypothetical protein KTAU_36030 [Thermogemmatispora aurantia]|uniref:Uncharacterized protein n=1 Tax=Thermogemmatispora aurantia TaxID=2045279 RepID=A0A5J4KEC6_9CHLR|nr:hypothetical protein [Thermogemmatispora aurantia]GER84967.1 hypothetical protein KTAU_36030 [Thermogemmatispora aurantia]